jgi:hypothetical protein
MASPLGGYVLTWLEMVVWLARCNSPYAFGAFPSLKGIGGCCVFAFVFRPSSAQSALMKPVPKCLIAALAVNLCVKRNNDSVLVAIIGHGFVV